MADVFITYARRDRDAARTLAALLAKRGYSVWYDFELLLGQNFTEVIFNELNAARAVIVLWSPDSVISDWVLQEAHYAFRDKKLIPLLLGDLDYSDIPPPYNFLHSIRYDEANRDAENDILRAVGQLVQLAPAPELVPAAEREPEPPKIDTPSASPARKAFVSYASEDEGTAIELVKHLETSECPCWISFRDVDPGEDYRDSIMRALTGSSFLVLVYSKNTNDSFDVATELLLARKKGKRRFVLKLDESEPDGKIEYELATVQWIDCIKDVKSGFQRVAQRAQLL